MPLFLNSTRRGALCATVLVTIVFLSGNLFPNVRESRGGMTMNLIADAAKFVHDIGEDFDPEEFDGLEEAMDDDEDFDYTPPPKARSPPKKKKKKTPAKKKKVVVEEDEDDEFGDDDWAIRDDDEEQEEDSYEDDVGEEEEDEFGEYDRAEQAKRKKSGYTDKGRLAFKAEGNALATGSKRTCIPDALCVLLDGPDVPTVRSAIMGAQWC